MNTVDAIADLDGKCANFLDTGGKATSETVKSSFRIILKDSRVKAIFVNIFGGCQREREGGKGHGGWVCLTCKDEVTNSSSTGIQ